MAEIVNLRAARKRAARRQREQRAAENRAIHGRTKSDRALEAAREAKLGRELDGHKREPEDRQ